MRIKQIELTGFKSFMDRTVLELPPGVTAIVGPNGCGKSNVVDAIRWVLGEQSPKHLRGGAMEDVDLRRQRGDRAARHGRGRRCCSSATRKTSPRAAEAVDEVTGGPESLPPELAHASEILVTRRYFRSGESEYFINKVACRLKDITELFLGTGVGTRAYAIIEQGRVEQIVNAKPEELRLFLEEAAGITRFRSRKHRRRAQDGAHARQPAPRAGRAARARAADGLAPATGEACGGVPPPEGRAARARPARHGRAPAGVDRRGRGRGRGARRGCATTKRGSTRS